MSIATTTDVALVSDGRTLGKVGPPLTLSISNDRKGGGMTFVEATALVLASMSLAAIVLWIVGRVFAAIRVAAKTLWQVSNRG